MRSITILVVKGKERSEDGFIRVLSVLHLTCVIYPSLLG